MKNSVIITFSEDFVAGDSIGVYYSDPSTQTGGYWTFTWVSGTPGTFEVKLGIPTTLAGEIDAIQFALAWANSLKGFTVTQPVGGNNNQVQITSQTYHFVNVLAKFSDGTTMAIPTHYNYVLSTVSTGNKITYEDKERLNSPTAENKYLWMAGDANEVKDKHNLNDDRISALEQETREIRNNSDSDFTIFGNRNSVYELAEHTEMTYKEGKTQKQSFDGLGLHAFTYVEKYKTIYATGGSDTDSNVEIYIFKDLDDLGENTKVTITTGYTYLKGSNNIIYSSSKDRLYLVPSVVKIDSSDTNIEVWELNPNNNSCVKIIELNIDDELSGVASSPFDYIASTTVIGEHLFVGIENILIKFDLYNTDYVSHLDIHSAAQDLSDLLTITGNQSIQGLATDGEKIWVTSSYKIDNTLGSGVYDSSYIARVDPTTMSLESIQYVGGNNSTDYGGVSKDIVLVGDYLYLPLESYSLGEETLGIMRVHKDDLSNKLVLQVPLEPKNNKLHSVYFDGSDLWYAGENNNLGKINIKTNESWLYNNPIPSVSSINQIQTDGQRIFLTGVESTSGGSGPLFYVGRTLFPMDPIRKVILKGKINSKDEDGEVFQELKTVGDTKDFTTNGRSISQEFIVVNEGKYVSDSDKGLLLVSNDKETDIHFMTKISDPRPNPSTDYFETRQAVLTHDGNFGIGQHLFDDTDVTFEPTEKLDVDGNALIRGNIYERFSITSIKEAEDLDDTTTNTFTLRDEDRMIFHEYDSEITLMIPLGLKNKVWEIVNTDGGSSTKKITISHAAGVTLNVVKNHHTNVNAEILEGYTGKLIRTGTPSDGDVYTLIKY